MLLNKQSQLEGLFSDPSEVGYLVWDKWLFQSGILVVENCVFKSMSRKAEESIRLEAGKGGGEGKRGRSMCQVLSYLH